MTIYDRIKTVIDDAGVTQAKFAESIEISPQSVSKIIKGDNNPSKQTISMICTKYGIRREWLETGKEPMKYPDPTEDASDINQLLAGEPDEVAQFARAFLKMAAKLTPERREQLNAFMRELKENWQ